MLYYFVMGAESSEHTQIEMTPNILAERYASPQMVHVFSPENKILLERDLWIAVMKAQRELGVDIPQDAIEKYEAVKNTIDIGSIKEREKRTKHDVKAGIEEFNELAGGMEYIHRGMTSRDLTDNVEQMQIKEGMQIIAEKARFLLCPSQLSARLDLAVAVGD